MRHALYIVDEDDAFRASLHALLAERFGCVVRVFRSRSAFLDELVDLPPGVLLIDIAISGGDGLGALKVASACKGRIVAVAMADRATVRLAIDAMRGNAADFIEKPCDSAAVIAAVEGAVVQLETARAEAEHKQREQANIAKLSSRERDVLRGLIDGRPNKLIAHELGLSPRTVEIYRANLMDKLNVRSLSEVLRIAFVAGIDF